MVAFNFTVNVERVEDGTKLSTIRRDLRAKVGDKLQLYTGQRTKACRKLRDAVCIGTARVEITESCPWRITNWHGVYCPKRQPLHEQEGFPNVAAFVDFFRQKYGLPFTGYLHVWKVEDETQDHDHTTADRARPAAVRVRYMPKGKARMVKTARG